MDLQVRQCRCGNGGRRAERGKVGCGQSEEEGEGEVTPEDGVGSSANDI